MTKIAIIGAGVAGVTAAEAARKASQETEITLVHDEPGLPYNRLNLTRMIAGEVTEGELELKKASWYDEKSIMHLHDSVTGIQRGSKEIILREGGRMAYDTLILATGANPFVPPIPGASAEGVSTLRTLAHAKEILASVKQGTRCVCIGGGLLGIELAAGLAKRGAQVTILEGFGWLLPRQLAPRAGELLKAQIEFLNIGVRCGVKVKEILGNPGVNGVALESGETLPAEMVLISAGVRPNFELAKDCGLETDRGLKVDDFMRTSDPSIFAAGDTTEHRGVVYGLWPAAMEQGRVAGTNAAGGNASFQGMPPSAFLKVVGVDVFSMGDFNPEEGDYSIIEREGGGNYAGLVLCQGILIGANLVGDTSAALAVKSAISKAKPVAENARLIEFFPELATAQ